MNNEPEDPTEIIILDRGMNRDECKAICTSPLIPLREKLFFRMIYETTTRPREVLEAMIELLNRITGEITFPKTKSKYNRWTRRHMCAQDHEADRQHQRDAAALRGEQKEGAHFH